MGGETHGTSGVHSQVEIVNLRTLTLGAITVWIVAMVIALGVWSGLLKERRVYMRTSDGQCVALIGRIRPAVVPQPSWRCEVK